MPNQFTKHRYFDPNVADIIYQHSIALLTIQGLVSLNDAKGVIDFIRDEKDPIAQNELANDALYEAIIIDKFDVVNALRTLGVRVSSRYHQLVHTFRRDPDMLWVVLTMILEEQPPRKLIRNIRGIIEVFGNEATQRIVDELLPEDHELVYSDDDDDQEIFC